jgi:biotin carboxylase
MSQGTRPAFRRLAIVNRGEPAMRLINAVREWNTEGRRPLRVIAVYTAADRRAMFVREADETVLIGLWGAKSLSGAVSCSDARGAAAGHDDRLGPFACFI